jgi:uncharacterized protein YdcH (DUF465 family)
MPMTTKVLLYRITRTKSRSSDIEGATVLEGVQDAFVSVVDDDKRINRSEFGNKIESVKKLTLWHKQKLNLQDKIELDTTINNPGGGTGIYEMFSVVRDYSKTDGSIIYMIRKQQGTQT